MNPYASPHFVVEPLSPTSSTERLLPGRPGSPATGSSRAPPHNPFADEVDSSDEEGSGRNNPPSKVRQKIRSFSVSLPRRSGVRLPPEGKTSTDDRTQTGERRRRATVSDSSENQPHRYRNSHTRHMSHSQTVGEERQGDGETYEQQGKEPFANRWHKALWGPNEPKLMRKGHNAIMRNFG